MLTGAGVAAVTVFLRQVDPSVTPVFPPCPFLTLTGWFCPGCGGLRAVHALGHGDLLGALDMNPLFALSVPLLVVLWAAWLYRAVRRRRPWTPSVRLVSGLAGGLVAFWVLRNIPVLAPYLAP